MTRLFVVAAICFISAAFLLTTGVFSVESGGGSLKTGVVSIGTDSMGHKLDIYSYKEALPKHIPDIRIYSTFIMEYDTYTEYEHDLYYDREHEQGIVAYYDDIRNKHIDYFTRLYLDDDSLFAKKHALVDHRVLSDGFSLDTYDISDQAREYENKTYRFKGAVYLDNLEVLKDGGKTVWVSARRSFLDVTRSGNGYVVLSNGGVDYVSFEGGKRVSDYYVKPFTGADYPYEAKRADKEMSGRMLTDNIARIEYPNGCLTHWKIKLTKEECDRNIDGIEIDVPNHQKSRASVVWYNGVGYELNKKQGVCRLLAWDFNADQRKEPSYK